MGTKEAFKNNLDKYLEQIPDQPEVEGLTPVGVDLYRNSSNSITDWPRSLGIMGNFSMFGH